MRMALFVEALESISQLDVIVIPVAGRAASADRFSPSTEIFTWEAEPETHFRLLSQIADEAQRLAAFEAYGKPSLSSVISERLLDRIGERVAAARYDLIHIARGYMLPILQGCDGTATISVDFDEDDAASAIMAATRDRRRSQLGRAQWLGLEARAFDRVIEQAHARLGSCFVSSDVERWSLTARHPRLGVSVIPNGVSIGKSLGKTDDGRTLGFIGSFGYAPNVDAVRWFADAVMPRIRARASRPVRLRVAGPNPPETVTALARRPCVEVLGAVPDVPAFYRGITLALVPVRLGRGLRIKLVEAGAHSTAFVATREGATGFAEPHRPPGWVAATAADFAEACVEALDNAGERRQRAVRGREIARRVYDRRRIIGTLRAKLAACLAAD